MNIDTSQANNLYPMSNGNDHSHEILQTTFTNYSILYYTILVLCNYAYLLQINKHKPTWGRPKKNSVLDVCKMPVTCMCGGPIKLHAQRNCRWLSPNHDDRSIQLISLISCMWQCGRQIAFAQSESDPDKAPFCCAAEAAALCPVRTALDDRTCPADGNCSEEGV